MYKCVDYKTANPATTAPKTPNPPTTILSPALPLALALAEEDEELEVELDLLLLVELVIDPLLTTVDPLLTTVVTAVAPLVLPPVVWESTITEAVVGDVVGPEITVEAEMLLEIDVVSAPRLVESEVVATETLAEVGVTIPFRSL